MEENSDFSVFERIFNTDFKNKIKELEILIVGVGGIGCEILKNLIKFSPKAIHLVDLDTIEVTNLNRQFYFRKEHRGFPKVEIAKRMIVEKEPNIKVFSYHENIKVTLKSKRI